MNGDWPGLSCAKAFALSLRVKALSGSGLAPPPLAGIMPACLSAGRPACRQAGSASTSFASSQTRPVFIWICPLAAPIILLASVNIRSAGPCRRRYFLPFATVYASGVTLHRSMSLHPYRKSLQTFGKKSLIVCGRDPRYSYNLNQADNTYSGRGAGLAVRTPEDPRSGRGTVTLLRDGETTGGFPKGARGKRAASLTTMHRVKSNQARTPIQKLSARTMGLHSDKMY